MMLKKKQKKMMMMMVMMLLLLTATVIRARPLRQCSHRLRDAGAKTAPDLFWPVGFWSPYASGLPIQLISVYNEWADPYDANCHIS